MEKSSFFNTVNGDRKYKSEDFAEFFNSLVTNGVFPNPSTNLQVIANNNMTITLKSGKAWINGHVYINTDDLVLNINVADGVLNRIDRLVLRLDTVNREIKAQVKKGVFASSPVAPTLQRDADGFELGIADVYIGKGTVSIVQANITDLRMNTGLCGWVNSLIQADTTAIFNQYLNWYQTTTGKYEQDINTIKTQFQQEFDTWFATIKDTLSGDVAGNLLNKVNALETNLSTANTNITNVTNDLATHKADNVKHITAIERTAWNAKVNQADYMRAGGYGVTAGTSTAYTLTLNPAPAAYVDGQQFIILPHVDCGTAPTLNVNGLGAGAILKQDGSAIAAGDIKANKPLSLVRVGSNFFIRNGFVGKKSAKGQVDCDNTGNFAVSGLDFIPKYIYMSGSNSTNLHRGVYDIEHKVMVSNGEWKKIRQFDNYSNNYNNLITVTNNSFGGNIQDTIVTTLKWYATE